MIIGHWPGVVTEVVTTNVMYLTNQRPVPKSRDHSGLYRGQRWLRLSRGAMRYFVPCDTALCKISMFYYLWWLLPTFLHPPLHFALGNFAGSGLIRPCPSFKTLEGCWGHRGSLISYLKQGIFGPTRVRFVSQSPRVPSSPHRSLVCIVFSSQLSQSEWSLCGGLIIVITVITDHHHHELPGHEDDDGLPALSPDTNRRWSNDRFSLKTRDSCRIGVFSVWWLWHGQSAQQHLHHLAVLHHPGHLVLAQLGGSPCVGRGEYFAKKQYRPPTPAQYHTSQFSTIYSTVVQD